jgi:nucleoside-diphosphate-sugar epimerase
VSRRVGQCTSASPRAARCASTATAGRIDFTYIDDLAASSSRSRARREERAFNLTHGNARSIKDLVAVIREHFPAVKVEHVQRDQLMPFRGTLGVDKARRVFGYAPASPIELGFPKYIEWYRQFTNTRAGGKRR